MEEIKKENSLKLQINREELTKIEDVPHTLIKLDRNAQNLQRMINNHAEEKKEQERKAREEYEKRIAAERKKQLIKRRHYKKQIKKALYITAGIAISTLAYKGTENIQGRNEIVKEFDKATNDFGIQNMSYGYQINEGITYVDFETGVAHMVEKAKEQGMSEQEIAIGLTSRINKKTAQEAIGKENYPTYKERCELYQEAYHTKESAKLQENIEKGTGK